MVKDYKSRDKLGEGIEKIVYRGAKSGARSTR